MVRIAVTAVAVCAITATLLAQQALPAFEVASVKPNTSGESDSQWSFVNGRFTGINVTLRMLLSTGYGQPQQPLPDYLMVGGPDWAGSARFDVVGTADSVAVLASLLRRLVEDRFRVRAHFEKRDMQVYALVLARKDGSLGPAIRRNTSDCDAVAAAGATPCGGQVRPGLVMGRGLTTLRIASALARIMPSVGMPVIDKTGLIGTFDFTLSWTPDQPVAPTPGIPTLPIDPNGPSLFSALQEQLGLKLEPSRGPVEVLMIDSVERPAPD